MKRSSSILVTGLSATLLATGWVAGSETFAADETTVTTAAEPALDEFDGASSEVAGDTSVSETAPADTTGAALVTGVFDGAAVSSRYGDFQAEITVEDGVMTAIAWLQAGEDDRRSQQINDEAMPILEQAILEAQSAEVSDVSGASFTSAAVTDAVYSAMQVAGIA